jgi:hypothetical protein
VGLRQNAWVTSGEYGWVSFGERRRIEGETMVNDRLVAAIKRNNPILAFYRDKRQAITKATSKQ